MDISFTTPKIQAGDGSTDHKWYVEFFYFDKAKPWERHRKRIYKGINTTEDPNQRMKLAEVVRDQIRDQLEKGMINLVKHRPGKNHFSWLRWEEKLEKWLDWKKRTRRKSTFQHYKAKCVIFLDWLNQTGKRRQDIQNFTREDAEDFVRWLLKKGTANSTVNDYVVMFRSICQEQVKKGELSYNPFEYIEKLRSAQHPAKRVSREDVSLISEYLEEHDPQLLMFLRFVFHCFIRPHSELRKMTVSWIDFSQETVRIPGDISKNHKEEILPIPKSKLLQSLQYLKEYPKDSFIFTLDGVPGPKCVGKNYFQIKFNQVKEKLKLDPGYTVYSFKHTGALMLLQNGASVKEIQMQMRHHSLDMTDKYLRQMVVAESDAIRFKSPSF